MANNNNNNNIPHYSWFAQNQEEVNRIANLPFLEVVGNPYPGFPFDSIGGTPGALVLPYIPCIGGESTFNSRVRETMDSYYQYLTQGFTGSVDFEAPDLFMTAVCGCFLASFFEIGRRVIGMLDYHIDFNKNYARSIIEALGFDYDALVDPDETVDTDPAPDSVSRRSQFTARFNELANKFGKLVAVPKKFMLSDRWKYINGSVFSDTSDAAYSTLYFFAPTKYLKYDGTSFTTGTAIVYEDIPARMTPKQYFTIIKDMLTALSGDDPRAMFGALRRVYSDSDLIKVAPLSSEYVTPIVKSDVAMLTLHNAKTFSDVHQSYTFLGGLGNAPYNPVRVCARQDAAGNIHSEFFAIADVTSETYVNYPFQDEVMLDYYDALSIPATTLEITSAIPAVSDDWIDITNENETTERVAQRIYPRTEILLAPKLAFAEGVNTRFVHSKQWINASSTVAVADLIAAQYITRVDSHPMIYFVNIPDSVSKIGGIRCAIGEVDKYTSISNGQLRKLHNASFATLLAMPENSKSVSK